MCLGFSGCGAEFDKAALEIAPQITPSLGQVTVAQGSESCFHASLEPKESPWPRAVSESDPDSESSFS